MRDMNSPTRVEAKGYIYNNQTQTMQARSKLPMQHAQQQQQRYQSRRGQSNQRRRKNKKSTSVQNEAFPLDPSQRENQNVRAAKQKRKKHHTKRRDLLIIPQRNHGVLGDGNARWG
jgi:hypothetical protein